LSDLFFFTSVIQGGTQRKGNGMFYNRNYGRQCSDYSHGSGSDGNRSQSNQNNNSVSGMSKEKSKSLKSV